METVELSISDYSQLRSLETFLRQATPDADISRVPGQPGPGEQGALDWLNLAVGSVTALVTVAQYLQTFLESRKPGTTVTISARRSAGRRVKSIDISNANDDQAKRIVDWYLDE